VAEAREAIRLSPNFAAPYRILSLALLRLNQSAEAKETIRRAQQLKLAEQAIEQLQAASRYEAAAEFWPQHLRGQAYLKLGRGAEATAEFQMILDHRGYAPLSPLYPFAHLGLARAAALTGDRAKSQKAWDDFFAAWKEADAGLPILTEARREFEK
jgi:tetratricopeptide (TPR) repeat protein